MLQKIASKALTFILAIGGIGAFIWYIVTKNKNLHRQVVRKQNELELKDAENEIKRTRVNANNAVNKYHRAKQDYRAKTSKL